MELIYLLVTLVSLCSTISSKYIDLRVKFYSLQLCPLKCKLFFFFFIFYYFMLCYFILFIYFIYLFIKENKK